MKESLLRKYLNGEASPEEVQHVLQWISSGKAPESISRLFDSFDPSSNNEPIDSEEILQKIHYQINIEESIDYPDCKETKERLILSDRKPIRRKLYPLNRKLKIAVAYSMFIVIFLVGLYFLPRNMNNAPAIAKQGAVFVEKSTEKGQKLNIQLSDGSRITLNSASSIVYQENFNDSIRQIELFGEAFFNVTQDSLRPFVVKTGELKTLALGTSFNIRYRPENSVHQVALVTGKVEVEFSGNHSPSKVMLEPGEMAGIHIQSKKMFRKNFDLEQVLAWKDGIIYFHNAGVAEIIQVLENWYGVTISTIGSPKEGWEFSAKFENESLRTVLEALQYAQDITYTLKDKHVTIEFAKGSGG